MTLARKLRLALLILAIGSVLAIAINDTYRLFWKRRSTLWQLHDLQQIQQEFSLVASNVPSAVEELDHDSLAVVTRKNPDALVRFQTRGRELGVWIDERKAAAPRAKITVFTPVEITVSPGELYNELTLAYSNYLDAASLLTNSVAATADFDQGLRTYEGIAAASRKLMAVAGQAASHANAIALLLHGSQQWFPPLRKIAGAFVILAALSALSMLLVLEIYGFVVRPLRKQLVDRETTIAQQKRLALRGEHASAVAHEIKNPLTAISVRLHTLQRALLEGSAEHEDALVIRSEISRLNRIVDDFLQLARPAAPELVSVSAASVLQQVRDLFAPQFAKQAIDLKLDVNVSAQFRADPNQLKQVLINLIKNAAESILHSGTIILHATTGTETLNGVPTEVVIMEVQDNGPGIPPKAQEHMFEPFFSTKEHGTGLGLPIAWQIVDKHGGMLDFRTMPNEGTTFRIVLPSVDKS